MKITARLVVSAAVAAASFGLGAPSAHAEYCVITVPVGSDVSVTLCSSGDLFNTPLCFSVYETAPVVGPGSKTVCTF